MWDHAEVRRFLSAAERAGVQTHVFHATAIETGMRKGELCGLRWEDVNLETKTISVRQTLLKPGPDPVMGVPKSGKGRAISISPALVQILRRHRAAQAEIRLRMGTSHRDFGFVFGKENGEPLQMNNLGQREFAALISEARVRRHTCATLLLSQGMHPKIVQERLGHSDIAMTLNRYSHVTPTMQESAAQAMGDLLFR